MLRSVYQAMTVAGLAAFLDGQQWDTDRWRLVAEFLEEFSHEPEGERLALLEAEPETCGDERWDVFLAGLAEYLAAMEGLAAPAWAESRRLVRFWFPFNSPAARTDAVVHSPASFRRRGIFIAPQELQVA